MLGVTSVTFTSIQGPFQLTGRPAAKKNQPDGKYLLHSVLVDGVSATSSPSLTTWFLTIETVND